MYSFISPVALFLVDATLVHVFVFTASEVEVVASDGPAPNASWPELFTPKPQSAAPPPHSEAMMYIVV